MGPFLGDALHFFQDLFCRRFRRPRLPEPLVAGGATLAGSPCGSITGLATRTSRRVGAGASAVLEAAAISSS